MNKLENKKIKVTFDDDKEILVKCKTRVIDALNMVKSEEEINEMLAVKLDNEIKTLDSEIINSSRITGVKYNTREGQRIYDRTVKFILSMAIERTYPDLDVEFISNIDNNSYFICKNMEFTPLMAVQILKEMRTIVSNNSKIERKVISYEEVRELFRLNKDERKLKSTEVKLSSFMTIYFCEDTCNTMYGVLAAKTGQVSNFEIKPFRKGFIVIYPDADNINKINNKIKENKIYNVFDEYSKYSDNIGLKSIADLTNEIINDGTEDVIKVSEAIQSNKMANLINEIDKSENIKMILIAGPSSSGKTTFAGKLATNLKILGYNPVAISMDNYYKDILDRYIKSEEKYDCESVYALDLELFNNHIKNLLAGKKVKLPIYNFYTGKRESSGTFLKLNADDILIIEGIHALNPLVSKSVDDKNKFKIYIAPITTLNIDDYSKFSATDTRILRRMVRDYNTRGHKVEKTFSMWADIMKGEKTYIYPFINSADYIFNTSLPYEISALKVYADPLLLQVSKDNEYFLEARRLYGLLKNFLPMQTKDIPADSIIREFIGKPS